MAKTTPDAATIDGLLDKGGVLIKRGGVWTYPGAANDRSGTNLVLPVEYVSDADVQEGIALGDLVVSAVDAYGSVAAVQAKPSEGELVRIVNPALAGTPEAGTEVPPNSRPTHDAGRTDEEIEYVVPATAAKSAEKPVEPVKQSQQTTPTQTTTPAKSSDGK